mmetsp:Transcript_7093/g.43883  ORF Transcript_7093/g.43883 Transcript_7093/m.43883 type:complete len:86 (+) Transcript_7093:4777-5034(+)
MLLAHDSIRTACEHSKEESPDVWFKHLRCWATGNRSAEGICLMYKIQLLYGCYAYTTAQGKMVSSGSNSKFLHLFMGMGEMDRFL